MFGEELFIRFTMCVFRVCVCASFPFGFDGGLWYFIVLSFFYFTLVPADKAANNVFCLMAILHYHFKV